MIFLNTWLAKKLVEMEQGQLHDLLSNFPTYLIRKMPANSKWFQLARPELLMADNQICWLPA